MNTGSSDQSRHKDGGLGCPCLVVNFRDSKKPVSPKSQEITRRSSLSLSLFLSKLLVRLALTRSRAGVDFRHHLRLLNIKQNDRVGPMENADDECGKIGSPAKKGRSSSCALASFAKKNVEKTKIRRQAALRWTGLD